jgi:hypothetical protein
MNALIDNKAVIQRIQQRWHVPSLSGVQNPEFDLLQGILLQRIPSNYLHITSRVIRIETNIMNHFAGKLN